MGKNKNKAAEEVEETKKEEVKKGAYQTFVSGIPYECSEEELRGVFADFQESIIDVKMPRYQDSGRCIGYAHVTFDTEETQAKALAKSGEKLKGRYLDIKEAQGSKSQLSRDQIKSIAESMPDDCCTLFVKGLPYDFKEDDIGDRFRKYGEIKAVRIAYNWISKQSKGFAYITFGSHESAKKALLEMNNREVKGRKLKIDFDVVQQPKQGYKINVSKEKNKFYNKEAVKEEQSKRRRKENEKKKGQHDRAMKSVS